MPNIYNVMSLFDGARIGYKALDKAGINVFDYSASEICKEAMSVANDNYPDCDNLGELFQTMPY